MANYTNNQNFPRANMEIWAATDDKNSSGAASAITDFSGKNRTLTAASAAPAYSTEILAGRGGVFFNGSNNPLAFTGAFNLKHAFILASYNPATFTANQGLLSGITGNPMLVGEAGGSSKFIDSGFGANFRYRIMDVLLPNSNQLAPVGGKVALIEIQYTTGFFLDGIQIGQDRNLTARKWNGYFFELIGYSAIKDDYDRSQIYQYFARKFHVWQQSVEGLDIFPFPANHSRSKSTGRRFFESEPYQGATAKLLRGARFSTLEANYETRRESEYTAALDFHAEHYGLRDFVFRDYKYYPPKDAAFAFTSDLKDAGGDISRLFNYGFSAKGAAAPSAPANAYGITISNDTDIFLIDR